MDHVPRPKSAIIYGKKRAVPLLRYAAWIFVYIIAGIILAGLWFIWQLFGIRGELTHDFVVSDGQGVNEISQSLYDTGSIRSKLVFETYIYLRNLESSIIAGKYQLPSASIVNLAKILSVGPGPEETSITFIEGWTLQDMAHALEKTEVADKDGFLALVSRPKASGFSEKKYPILYSKPDSVDLEGYLFPDTYRVFNEVASEQVIDIMLQTLTKRITLEMAEDIDEQGKTLHEILTMASIIEKEVRTDRDRRIVSGVLWNRIEAGVPLQVDSTVNYITGNDKPSVTLDETTIDSPFNTYRYKGLPPGPIANPGLSSIMAAVYPAETEYFFYLSKPDGETVFSETFEQHIDAKNKYLK